MGSFDSDLLSTELVAGLLGVEVRAVQQYALAGYLTPVSPGRFLRSEVEALKRSLGFYKQWSE